MTAANRRTDLWAFCWAYNIRCSLFFGHWRFALESRWCFLRAIYPFCEAEFCDEVPFISNSRKIYGITPTDCDGFLPRNAGYNSSNNPIASDNHWNNCEHATHSNFLFASHFEPIGYADRPLAGGLLQSGWSGQDDAPEWHGA